LIGLFTVSVKRTLKHFEEPTLLAICFLSLSM